jgi:transcriptional regulator with XRE-family HTH domain
MRSSPAADPAKRGEIGRRIRAVRTERHLTLRQVASRARLSATHISEIERGHTTPTVGALVRIAAALGREPHFFLEAEWLPEVSVVRRADAKRIPHPEAATGHADSLTQGIPGGRLACARLTIEPGVGPSPGPSVHGEVGGYVLRGRLEIRLGEELISLGPGDGFHLSADLPHSLRNAGEEPAEVLWVASNPANSSR